MTRQSLGRPSAVGAAEAGGTPRAPRGRPSHVHSVTCPHQIVLAGGGREGQTWPLPGRGALGAAEGAHLLERSGGVEGLRPGEQNDPRSALPATSTETPGELQLLIHELLLDVCPRWHLGQHGCAARKSLQQQTHHRKQTGCESQGPSEAVTRTVSTVVVRAARRHCTARPPQWGQVTLN